MSAEDQKLLAMLNEYLELMKQVPEKDRFEEDEEQCPNAALGVDKKEQ